MWSNLRLCKAGTLFANRTGVGFVMGDPGTLAGLLLEAPGNDEELKESFALGGLIFF